MNTYHFTNGNEKFEAKSDRLVDAFGSANKHFGSKLKTPGAWMESKTPFTFKWNEGNFSD
jgi:hypothetical protein